VLEVLEFSFLLLLQLANRLSDSRHPHLTAFLQWRCDDIIGELQGCGAARDKADNGAGGRVGEIATRLCWRASFEARFFAMFPLPET
jgi:hypothetical protein